MLVLPQVTKVKWASGNKNWYVNKGYIFTKIGDEFLVNVEDLTKGSTSQVIIECDNCHSTIKKRYGAVLKLKEEYCCKNCTSGRPKQYTFNDVYNLFKENECVLLSGTYKDVNQALNFICSCGRESKISFVTFIKTGKCKVCTRQEASKKMSLSFNEVEKTFAEQECILLSTSYTNNRTKLKYICNCGNIDEKTLDKFKNGQRCQKCRYMRSAEKMRLEYETVKKIFEDRGCVLLTKDYKNMEQILDYICKCGNKSQTSLINFPKISGCYNCCQKSKGEYKIQEYLINHKLTFLPQYSFNDCKLINRLRYDFAVFDSFENVKLLIEFDGAQHYKPVEIWGGEEQFEKQQEIDRTKNKYCTQNSIPLLRIPYWDFDNIEEILTKELNLNNNIK